jgi:hypothetical protein
MADITKAEAEEIMRKIEARGTLGISFIERAVEEKVKQYRDELTREVIDKVQAKHEPVGSMPCKCGGVAKYKDNKKKRFS